MFFGHSSCVFYRGRDLLVDGGYTDNLPLLQMVCEFVRVTHRMLPTSLMSFVKVRMKPRHGIGCIIASDVERRNNSSLREVRSVVALLVHPTPGASA